ncbi:MAG: tetratricopeptide repeat protein [Myxococcota bacterium]|nr:tetratricopeptide repeat protein [Myxococcota bacterium]
MSGQGDEATLRFEAGLTQDPSDEGCLLGLMRLHALSHDLPSAVAFAQRLLQRSPQHPEAHSHQALHRFEEGEAGALEELAVLAAAPGAGVYERLNLARALSHLGKVEAAERAFQEAIAQEPANPVPSLEAADAALDRGDAQAAVHHLTTACRIAPGQARLWTGLAEAKEAAEDYPGALAALDRASQLDPGDLPLLEYRYDVATRAEDWSAAVQTARQLVAKAPEELQYLFQLGEALTFAGELDQAQKTLEKLALLDATAPEPMRALAEVFIAKGDRERAISVLLRAVTLAPDEPGPTNDLANLYFEEPGGMAQAVELLRPIYEAHPEDAVTAFNLALALAKDHPAEALGYAKQVTDSGHPDLAPEAARLMAALRKLIPSGT